MSIFLFILVPCQKPASCEWSIFHYVLWILLHRLCWNAHKYFFKLYYLYTVVGVYINTIKTTFLSKFWFLTRFFIWKVYVLGLKSKQRQVVKMQFFFVSMFNVYVFQYAVWKLGKIKIEVRLHCIDIYDPICILTLYIFMVLLLKTHTQNNILFTTVRTRTI